MKALKVSVALILCLLTISFPTAFAAKSKAELVTPPNRTVFYEGKDWDYTRREITPFANFDLEGTVVDYNGEIKTYFFFPWGGNMWAEPVSGSWHTGVNDVYIYLDDYDGEVYAEGQITLCEITKIQVVTYPTDTTLIRGINWHYDKFENIVLDSLDFSGTSVEVFYSDGTREILPYNQKNGLRWEVASDNERFSLGRNKISASYFSKTAPVYYDFVYESIIRVSVNNPPEKNLYHYNTDWNYKNGKISPDINLNGLSVLAVYNNGRKETIAYNDAPSRFSMPEDQNFARSNTVCTVMLDNEFSSRFNIFIYSYGDVNNDGMINSTDALLVLRGVVKKVELDSDQKRYADVNADGRINSSDALQILNRSVGIIDGFKAEDK